ncbi:hypothetical protein CpB0539 [Chlamydia pneumoniae TW-183]|uniref:UPF0158 protein CPn_0518/CP_0235/CPj0518/CpB0539 n=2 Tax=Chlamydia pneumoniae TaxID=83558 RepID=Y518_CHLPN|nr:UPF0158 family protein [Chlamydia pneumoniae]Q9Z834.1 RecName: Full=UPF0158 protein CPn_0518/CP_0235/CPj0518/CpB0539 [Chlamydia pneumoniae]AAD18658.1 CT429 hypothetical protein [Chlamydia pneumoniae CWL029]AAF38100.1 conserved hypothetical protein [Chlamydia pneumoniae AR39]AAP98468.1 hypothetical protein CpB0539 [Chlamydia pneumoniae TW-183]CRI33029.1 UPF0158 protein CPn_0518/CP_0235/CPj0518/CpB0539 [Chlamydia pneumoniae]CRI35892.1 UPF0158 protein CPn_0518/CP_0235/CPj0518/CpB0539 [Chlamyd
MMTYPVPQNPLLLRILRLMDAFSKSDDERDFYLDRVEGFILYIDLDKDQEDLNKIYQELEENAERYCLIPKLTFYEVKKIMETFINEKIYDIDTKEKFLEILQSKNAREQFLEFIYDHEAELEKWQQFYVERSRIRIIEWLRNNKFHFVFEEDLDFTKNVLEQLKIHLFDAKVGKEITQARQLLSNKAKIYYSNEALNPRPKRGRPPKQSAKVETETTISSDIYTKVPQAARRFLFLPEITSPSSITFSEKFDTEEEFLANLRGSTRVEDQLNLTNLSERFASLKELSAKLGYDSLSTGDFFGDDDEKVVTKTKGSKRGRKKSS